MKATGLVRRIDDLGRVVIPKEIRRKLRIREGDPLELLLDDDKVIFRKYSFISPIEKSNKCFAEILSEITGRKVSVFNNVGVGSLASPGRKGLKSINTVGDLADSMRFKRDVFVDGQDGASFSVYDQEENPMRVLAAVPLFSEGEFIGGVMLLENEDETHSINAASDAELNALKVIAAQVLREYEMV